MKQPECDCPDNAPPLRYWRCPKCDAEWGIEPDDELTDEDEALRQWRLANGIQKEGAP